MKTKTKTTLTVTLDQAEINALASFFDELALPDEDTPERDLYNVLAAAAND